MPDGWFKSATVPLEARYRFRLGDVTLSEAEVGQTIQQLMGMSAPNALYWALVNSMPELEKLRRDEAAEAARKRAQWDQAKWGEDTSGFTVDGEETSETRRRKAREADEERVRNYYGQFDGVFEEIFRRSFFYGSDRAKPGSDRTAFHFRTESAKRQWWEIIGCSQHDNRAAINAAYRKRAMAIHTEALGEEALKELNVAKDLAFKLVLS